MFLENEVLLPSWNALSCVADELYFHDIRVDIVEVT